MTVYGWLSLYRAGGWGRLDAKKRGGRKPKLDARAPAWIRRTVTNKDPRQFKFPFALWAGKMVGEVIRGKFGVRLSKSSVCGLLGPMGLSAQRPPRRAYQQDPKMVDRRLEEEYPAIRAEAERRKAEIWFADEAGVFIECLKRLIHHAPRKIFLIVDGHPRHKAKKVRDYVSSVADRPRLFLLPPYSPELNPDELAWNDLKNNAIDRVRSHFQTPTTIYADE